MSVTSKEYFGEMFKLVYSESNIDDVLQISNIFVNVSKGEVAKTNDLEKAFGTLDTDDIVKEVRWLTVDIVRCGKNGV